MRGDQLTRVLLVEDNLLDVRAMRRAVEKLGLAVRIDHVTNGSDALEHLGCAPPGRSSELPDLVLLDLNLPGKDGRDVLATFAADPNLCTVPVVVLTTSDAESDVEGAYAGGATAFVTKPVDLDGWLDVARKIQSRWVAASDQDPTS